MATKITTPTTLTHTTDTAPAWMLQAGSWVEDGAGAIFQVIRVEASDGEVLAFYAPLEAVRYGYSQAVRVVPTWEAELRMGL